MLLPSTYYSLLEGRLSGAPLLAAALLTASVVGFLLLDAADTGKLRFLSTADSRTLARGMMLLMCKCLVSC